MAKKDTKRPGPQPAEDMFGRPTHPHGSPEPDRHTSRKSTEEEDEEAHRRMGGLDELSDGDGPRSDRNNNPLPDSYWADYPGEKP